MFDNFLDIIIPGRKAKREQEERAYREERERKVKADLEDLKEKAKKLEISPEKIAEALKKGKRDHPDDELWAEIDAYRKVVQEKEDAIKKEKESEDLKRRKNKWAEKDIVDYGITKEEIKQKTQALFGAYRRRPEMWEVVYAIKQDRERAHEGPQLYGMQKKLAQASTPAKKEPEKPAEKVAQPLDAKALFDKKAAIR